MYFFTPSDNNPRVKRRTSLSRWLPVSVIKEKLITFTVKDWKVCEIYSDHEKSQEAIEN